MSRIDLPTLWGRPWWKAAEALALLGYEVLVVDPAAGQDEALWDGLLEHGTIRVIAYPLAGWTVGTHEMLSPLYEPSGPAGEGG